MNRLTAIIRILKGFISRKRRSGRSLIQVLLLDLPLRLSMQLYLTLASFVNESIITPILTIPRFQEFQRINAGKLHDHFYVIVMPRTLHFLIVCLKLIPKKVNVILLLNGIDSWEEAYVRRHCEEYPIFRLSTCPKSSLSHGSVLNLLIDRNDSNFGILDHDFFIFNPALFDNLRFEDTTFAIGAFKLRNSKAGLEFPTTHFLFFNIELVDERRLKLSDNDN